MTTVLTEQAPPNGQGPFGDPTGRDLLRIPLTELHPHPANRKRMKEAALKELADNLKAVGQLEPALVRPRPQGGYQLLSGERRWRASKLAGLTDLLCLRRELTDEQAIVVVATANDQQEHPDPLDEAEIYKQMLLFKGWTPARIAKQLGRGETYIRDRLRLLRLTPEARKLVIDETITLQHAVLLASLTAAMQQRVIKGDGGSRSGVHGLFREESTLFSHGKKDRVVVSVDELRDWIKDQVRFDPRAEVTAELWPETAAAVQEADATNQKVLLLTTDYMAASAVRDGVDRVFGRQSWKRADGAKGAKTCDFSKLGVLVSGEHQSEAFQACVRRDKCLVHWPQSAKAAAKRAKARAHTSGESGAEKAAAKETPAQKAEREAKVKAAAAAEAAENARWEKARPALAKAFGAKLKQLSMAEYKKRLVQRWHPARELAACGVTPGSTTTDLLAYLLGVELLENGNLSAPGAITSVGDREDWVQLLEEFGLDAKKLVDQVAPAPKVDLAPRAKAAVKPKKRAGDVRRAKAKKKAGKA